MPAVILAVIEQPKAAPFVLAGAARLASLAGTGRINVLATRVPPMATIMVTEEVLTPQRERQVRAREQERTAALRAAYDAWTPAARAAGVQPEWHDIEAVAAEAVAKWGRRADYLVLKRPARDDGEVERQGMHAALFATDRPVLAVPPETMPALFGRHVAIAWRDDDRAIRAVLAALRWLGHAERIHVLAGARASAPPPRLPELLAEHGVAAELVVLSVTGLQAFGKTLLETAHGLGADMLVMGAFAHHPLRSLLLGGVTRYMLSHADLPLFMRH